ncbi:MAG: hypothetical protein IKL55_01060 [Clostridia bacterium]|nr:hypothetical protein [Clostridia bacterium]
MEKDKKKSRSIFVLIFLILLFILLLICCALLNILKKQDTAGTEVGNTSVSAVDDLKEPDTVQSIIEKYDSKYIEQSGITIYLEFAKDLYQENGNSNKVFFENLIGDLIPFFEKNSFYLIDNSKDIYIFIKYKDNEHTVIINDIEDFYDKTNGKKYIEVENAKIAQGESMVIEDYYLVTLMINNFYFKSIEGKIGEGKVLENGYTSYLDGKLKLRTIPTKGVRNIVISDDYEENITTKINMKTSLEQIKELEPNYAFGSLSEKYLGYRQSDYYLFFYNDEVSLYPYSYKKNDVFEETLKEYLENKNLDSFVKNLSKKWMAYDHLEYDEETQSADILYSTRGVHIKIHNNSPKGITLYENYYFTDYTKSLVKNGIIDFEPDVDLVEKIELERRKSN